MAHFLQLLLLLALAIAAAKLAGTLAARIGQPAVFGEILIGLILGPTVLNILGWPIFSTPVESSGTHVSLDGIIRDLAEIGVLLLMFVAGLETDLQEMRRVGKVAFWSALGGVLLPLAGGVAISVAFGFSLLWEAIFIGTILTATSVSISAQTLLEIGALRSREGATILGAAVIDDVMGIVLLSLVVAFAKASAAGVDVAQLGAVGLRIVLYFVLALYTGRFLPAVLAWANQLPVSQALLAAAVVIAMLYAWAAEYVGTVAAITGAYVAGVLIGQTRFKAEIDDGIHPLAYSIFVPIFFISIGLQANGRALGNQFGFTITLIAIAIVAKAVGCALFAKWCGFTNQESLRVGIGMISRGEVGLIVAGYGLSNGIIGADVFSASVIMVLVTTMVTPPLLRLVFPRSVLIPTSVEETIGHVPRLPEWDVSSDETEDASTRA
jgi:Kef-type K+ transport system membrane component KefB